MDLPFLYIVDGVLMLSVFYACFCVKTPEECEEYEESENDEISALV